MCNTDLKGIDGTKRRSHERSTGTHRYSGYRIKANASRENQQHRYEGDDLFLHVLEHATSGEDHRNHGNDEQLSTIQLPHKPSDRTSQCSCLVYNGESTTDEEHQEDDRSRIGHAEGNGHEHLKRPDGILLHLVKRSRNNDLSSRRLILLPIVPTGRQDVAQGRREKDAPGEECENVGKAGGGQ